MRSYKPDFLVIESNGNETFYEIKGWMDPKSKTKIKRMAKYHESVKLIVIDAKAYKRLSIQVRGLIPGW